VVSLKWYRPPDGDMILRAKCDILDSEKKFFIYLSNNHYTFNDTSQYCRFISIKREKNKGFTPTENFANLSKSNKKTKVTPYLVTDKNNHALSHLFITEKVIVLVLQLMLKKLLMHYGEKLILIDSLKK
jgi:hypothetical protein